MATGFYSLLSWRIVTGVGSAGIVTLAGPFIDDIAPVSAKTLWFGMLYLVSSCISSRPTPSYWPCRAHDLQDSREAAPRTFSSRNEVCCCGVGSMEQ